MDPISASVILPILEDALASATNLEWAPAPGAPVGVTAFRAEVTARNGSLIRYTLNAYLNGANVTLCLWREVSSPKAEITLPVYEVISELRNAKALEWKPLDPNTPFAAELVGRLFVEVQEASAALILKADAVTNV